MGKTEISLSFLDESLLKYKGKNFDRYSLLNYKYDLLSKAFRFQGAAEVCVEKASIVTSPRLVGEKLRNAIVELVKNNRYFFKSKI